MNLRLNFCLCLTPFGKKVHLGEFLEGTGWTTLCGKKTFRSPRTAIYNCSFKDICEHCQEKAQKLSLKDLIVGTPPIQVNYRTGTPKSPWARI